MVDELDEKLMVLCPFQSILFFIPCRHSSVFLESFDDIMDGIDFVVLPFIP